MILLVYPFPQESAIPYWYQIITIFRIVRLRIKEESLFSNSDSPFFMVTLPYPYPSDAFLPVSH